MKWTTCSHSIILSGAAAVTVFQMRFGDLQQPHASLRSRATGAFEPSGTVDADVKREQKSATVFDTESHFSVTPQRRLRRVAIENLRNALPD